MTGRVEITILILHKNAKIIFEIPLNNYTQEEIEKTRVYFGRMGEMLLIWIPSVYVRFIDCSIDQDASMGNSDF